MNHTQLNRLWQLLDSMRPTSAGELCVHSVGIRSGDSDLCIGRDQRARRHLLVPLPADKTSALPFHSSGLLLRTRPLIQNERERPYLDLVCLLPDLNEVFSHLIIEVLQQMQPDEPNSVEICRTVLDQWKELFGAGSLGMGREQIVGLVGELILVEKLTAINPSALLLWDGPAGGIHDFRSEHRALEVKASTRRYGRFFQISGLQQLESPKNGDLHFAALKLEQNPGGFYSIPNLIEKIRRNGVNPSLLLQKLNDVGYAPSTSEQVENSRFDISEDRLYRVIEPFPRLTAASFAGGQIPGGVIKVSYELDLSGDTPVPLTSTETDSFIRTFAIGGLQ